MSSNDHIFLNAAHSQKYVPELYNILIILMEKNNLDTVLPQ